MQLFTSVGPWGTRNQPLGHSCTIFFSCLLSKVLNDLWRRDSQALLWVHTGQGRPSKSRTWHGVLLEGKATPQLQVQSRPSQPA